MEAIRKLPDGTGWILDGFPTNLEQAILLEKALTGKDVSSTTSIPEKKKRYPLGFKKITRYFDYFLV